MDQWAFFDEFKAGMVRSVYLFYGPEAYIRKSALATLQKKLLMPGLEAMNCTFMQSPTAQQIVENCETLPMMGDVLPGHSVSIAHFCEHAAHVAVCRGGVREILIVAHILGFQTRDAAERRDDRQSGQIII